MPAGLRKSTFHNGGFGFLRPADYLKKCSGGVGAISTQLTRSSARSVLILAKLFESAVAGVSVSMPIISAALAAPGEIPIAPLHSRLKDGECMDAVARSMAQALGSPNDTMRPTPDYTRMLTIAQPEVAFGLSCCVLSRLQPTNCITFCGCNSLLTKAAEVCKVIGS